MTAAVTGQPSLTQVEEGALALAGEVTAASAPALRARGEALIRSARESGRQTLTLDLAGLATASSIVLSLLLCWQRHARAQGLALTYTGTGDRLCALAGLGNLEPHLPGLAESH